MAGPVADVVENAIPLPRRPPPALLLRPPGALPEAEFLSTCYRSGNCMDACPADAIQPLADPDPNLSGTPVIIPSQRACVVCDSLACMAACPSGALTPLLRHQIRVGLAAVDLARCVRTRRPEPEVGPGDLEREAVGRRPEPGVGPGDLEREAVGRSPEPGVGPGDLEREAVGRRPEPDAGPGGSNTCVACIESCPIGRTAIGLTETGAVAVSAAHCVGCGMCEQVCPTTPKAVRVQPLGV